MFSFCSHALNHCAFAQQPGHDQKSTIRAAKESLLMYVHGKPPVPRIEQPSCRLDISISPLNRTFHTLKLRQGDRWSGIPSPHRHPCHAGQGLAGLLHVLHVLHAQAQGAGLPHMR